MAYPELPYDFEDFGLDAQELKEKYRETKEHPEYTIAWWLSLKDDPSDYWDCVLRAIAEDDEAYPCNGE